MENGIRFEVIWFDVDLTEILVQCSNGRFHGTAQLYLAHDKHLHLASVLKGFPSSVHDSKTIEVGTFNPTHAGGGLRIELRCADSTGHVLADVKLRGDVCKSLGEIESVALKLCLEPAAIDTFVNQLETMGATVGASAFLSAEI